jgi:hypothetical protein
MGAKSVGPGKKTVTRKKAAVAVPLVMTDDVRRQLVAAEAYFRAERRGFVAGNELEDWIAAEAVVDSQLQQMRVA